MSADAGLLVIPPYGSIGGYLVYCVFAIFCHFVILFVFCTVTDFSAAEKVRGVKFCMHIGLLSGQVFSPFGEHWLAGVTGAAALLPGSMAPVEQLRRCMARAFEIGGGGVA